MRGDHVEIRSYAAYIAVVGDLQSLARLGDLVAMVEVLDGLLETDGEQQAEAAEHPNRQQCENTLSRGRGKLQITGSALFHPYLETVLKTIGRVRYPSAEIKGHKQKPAR